MPNYPVMLYKRVRPPVANGEQVWLARQVYLPVPPHPLLRLASGHTSPLGVGSVEVIDEVEVRGLGRPGAGSFSESYADIIAYVEDAEGDPEPYEALGWRRVEGPP